MTAFLERFGVELWAILVDSGVWLIVGLALAGAVHVLVPREVLARHLAGRGVSPVLKASLLGIPLPLCSCSVIPVAAGLRASGASKGASAAFAISTPQTGEESVPLTWALFGPVYALARPILAVATAFAAGVAIDRLVGEGSAARRPVDEPPGGRASEPSSGRNAGGSGTSCGCGAPAALEVAVPGVGGCCDGPGVSAAARVHAGSPGHIDTCCADTCCSGDGAGPGAAGGSGVGGVWGIASRSRWGRGLVDSLRYGFGTLLLDLAPWLTVGLLLSALVAALVPAGWIESNIGTGIGPMLLMLVVGLPLYVCATSTTPLVYSLVVAGLSPGAGLVLLLAGPATNLATMSWVIKDLGARALAIYLLVISVFALAAGLLFDSVLGGLVNLAEQGVRHDHAAVTLFQGAGAALLAVMLLWALGERLAVRLRRRNNERSRAPGAGENRLVRRA